MTRARFTKWGPIVYSAVSKREWCSSPIIRMALHPVLDDEEQGMGPRFPCRVVWDDASSDRGFRWSTSCRGVDALSGADHGADSITPTGPTLDPGQYRADPGEDVDGIAIAWLIEGERPRAREQRRRKRAKG